MDPLTAALNLANTIAQIILEQIKGQPPEVRQQMAQMQLDQMKGWHEFLSRFKLPKADEKP